MATERQLQFRVGMLVIVAAAVCAGLVIRFGDVRYVWKKRYPLTIQLENGAGLYPTAPVLLSGLVIGSVREIGLNQAGGVNVLGGGSGEPFGQGSAARPGMAPSVDRVKHDIRVVGTVRV